MISSYQVRVSGMQSPGGCPHQSGGWPLSATGPKGPLSAPRADANLSPEQSAALATVQVGKTLPWGSEHRRTDADSNWVQA